MHSVDILRLLRRYCRILRLIVTNIACTDYRATFGKLAQRGADAWGAWHRSAASITHHRANSPALRGAQENSPVCLFRQNRLRVRPIGGHA